MSPVLKAPTAKEVRQARLFLRSRGARSIQPAEFAGTAKEMALSFAALWSAILEEKNRGRQQA